LFIGSGGLAVRVLQTAFDADAMSERLPVPEFSLGTSLFRIQKEGKLRVGVCPDAAGFCSLNVDTGRYEGLDVSFARKIAQAVFGGSVFRINPMVQFLPISMGMREVALEEDWVDMVVSSYAITPERRKLVDFTDPYYGTSLSPIVKAEGGIEVVSDLKDIPIAVVEGTTGADFARAHDLGSKILEAESVAEIVDMVRDGTVGAGLSAATILDTYAADSAGVLIRPQWMLEHIAFGVGVKKGDTYMRDFVNKRSNELVDHGFVALAEACRTGSR
jgi:ABC-type amino acid transport substrate-binding protein